MTHDLVSFSYLADVPLERHAQALAGSGLRPPRFDATLQPDRRIRLPRPHLDTLFLIIQPQYGRRCQLHCKFNISINYLTHSISRKSSKS
ncbi:hypothetical protein EMIT0111MI5_30217 [Burkholderia sp. IT-111MI5]